MYGAGEPELGGMLARMVRRCVKSLPIGLGLFSLALISTVYLRVVSGENMSREDIYEIASEIYVVPEGYTGRVRIVYGIEEGQNPECKGKTPVYHVPSDGFVLTRSQPPSNSGPAAFFYEGESGMGDHIESQLTTIKPSNIGDDPGQIYVFEGGLRHTVAPSRLDCDVYNKRHWVGTRESIWSGVDKNDVIPYLVDQGIGCDAISTEEQAR